VLEYATSNIPDDFGRMDACGGLDTHSVGEPDSNAIVSQNQNYKGPISKSERLRGSTNVNGVIA